MFLHAVDRRAVARVPIRPRPPALPWFFDWNWSWDHLKSKSCFHPKKPPARLWIPRTCPHKNKAVSWNRMYATLVILDISSQLFHCQIFSMKKHASTHANLETVHPSLNCSPPQDFLMKFWTFSWNIWLIDITTTSLNHGFASIFIASYGGDERVLCHTWNTRKIGLTRK